jgi:Zinc carboxypeptidase
VRDGRRRAVLYISTFHAREWISTEVNRRLLHWYIDQWRAGNPEIRSLLRNTELWFVLAHNPDGYQYTFDVERLWRKNMRDNDGDGEITRLDGVDPNRNLPEHWNWDDEGSNTLVSSDTYRGPAAGSEPETQALMRLHRRVPFKLAISYHSFGELLLYTQGWQTLTPSADDPIYVALSGTDDDPAIEGYNPGVGADLYTTNGEYTDWAHAEEGTLAWTPELAEGCEGCGFVFPDDEALIEAEFRRNLDFAVNVARSADDPDDPVSHAGIDTADFYLDVADIDPWKTNNPSSDLDVDLSYAGGSSQQVEVLAKKSLDDVELHYRINGGRERDTSTRTSPDGERFGGNNAYDIYYEYRRGRIRNLSVGDTVEYWFTAEEEDDDDGDDGRRRGADPESGHATFEVVEDADADVLIVAAEDRTGASNLPAYSSTDPNTPNYLSFYTDALSAAGVSFDVYDVDARGRQAPDHLGVLSHYDAVVWYTGNDLITREAGWTAGNASRLANDMTLEMRAYLNQGGKLLYTGQWAGGLENGVGGNQFYDPVANERCVTPGQPQLARCLLIADKNDLLQYHLGAMIYNSDAGTDPDGNPFGIDGIGDPFGGLSWGLNGADSADNQVHTASLITTSSILKPDEYPQFASEAPAAWDTGVAGAFEPFDGAWYAYSDRADITYKRLMRTIDLTGVSAADAPTLTFRTSYDTEPAWDFVFVEAHTVGQDDWVTLPDASVPSKTSNDTGESCPAGWHELHPWLERYQGADCSGAGWNAASGRSDGWEEWKIDLSAYAGRRVELSISYASDWAVQGLGTFLDKVEMSTGDGSTSFETGLDGWTVAGPPPGSSANPTDWRRTESVGFQEGAVTSTEDTLYFGFGAEGISGAGNRQDVLGRAVGRLLASGQ